MAEAREELWSPFGDWRDARLSRPGWSASAAGRLGQTLVTGDIARAVQALAPTAGEAGLWQIHPGLPVLVRVGRDRALLVTAEPLGLASGWNRQGWAVSPQEDAFRVFEIAGTDLEDVVAEATAADLVAGSPSAAILFAGVRCLLYRTGPRAARLHVEAALAPYLWRWLELRPQREAALR